MTDLTIMTFDGFGPGAFTIKEKTSQMINLLQANDLDFKEEFINSNETVKIAWIDELLPVTNRGKLGITLPLLLVKGEFKCFADEFLKVAVEDVKGYLGF